MSNAFPISKNTKIYDDFYLKGEIDGWDDADKRLNFYYLFKIFDSFNIIKHKPTILDVGCGAGDMVRFLPVYRSYLGIDIYRPALYMAKIENNTKNASFKYGNILTSRIKSNSFDFVLSSGALSMNLNTLCKSKNHPNYDFLKNAVSKMFKIAKYGVAFNVLVDRNLVSFSIMILKRWWIFVMVFVIM